MYTLHVEKCKGQNRRCVSEAVYRNIFCTEYNLSFFHPKKDQCPLCNLYDTSRIEDRLDEATKAKYQVHQERKNNAKMEKSADKERAKKDPKSAFDIQAISQNTLQFKGRHRQIFDFLVLNFSFIIL
jgi:hypothetical protein